MALSVRMLPVIDKRQQLVLRKLKRNYKVIDMVDIHEDCDPFQKTNPCKCRIGDVLDYHVVGILSQFDKHINIQIQ